SELLLLLRNIEGLLREVACLLQRLHLRLGLLERVLRVTHIKTDALFLLFEGDFLLAVLKHSAELVGLGDAVAQRDVEFEADLILRVGVVEAVLQGSAEAAGKSGGAKDGAEVAGGVGRSAFAVSGILSVECERGQELILDALEAV